MKSSAAVRLFGATYSVYTRIARLALLEKSVPFEFVAFDIYDASTFPAGYADLHPFRKIPALQHGNFGLHEAQAITRYVDRALEGPSLQPSDPVAAAWCDCVVAMNDAYGFSALIKGVYVERISKPARGQACDETTVLASLKIADKYLQRLDAGMAGRNWLAGDSVTLADIHSYPMIRYFWLEPDGRKLIGTYPAISRWMTRFSERQSARETLPPAESNVE
ncbi:MAG: glutathione S-transferase family protein [Rhodospirillales bacterium]